jgi:hypothetical protein
MFEDLYSYLKNKNITVYPDKLPSSAAYPAIVYQLISVDNQYSLSGNVKLTKYNMQYTVLATSRGSTIAKGAELKSALDDYSGVMESANIQRISILNEIDNYDPQTSICSKIIEFEIIVKEE